MEIRNALGEKAELFFKALAGEATPVKCTSCGTFEQLVPLDGDLDEIFLANYVCDRCEKLG